MKRKSLLALLLAASMAASMTAATGTVAFAEEATEETPPCTNENNPVDIRPAATIFIMFQRFPLLYSNLVAFVHEQDSRKHRQN